MPLPGCLHSWQLEGSWCTELDKVCVSVVCVCMWVFGEGGKGFFIILTWKVVCLEMWHISDKLCLHWPPSVFYITLLAKLSLHISNDVFGCSRGMNSWEMENGEVEMKNHQVFTFHMAALNSLHFDSMPLQLKLWIMMFFCPFDLSSCVQPD